MFGNLGGGGGGGLFGNNAGGGGGGLFQQAGQQQQQGGLFGAAGQQGGLFGGGGQQQQQQSGGMMNGAGAGGLFGQSAGGMFGQQQGVMAGGGGVSPFGGIQQQQPQTFSLNGGQQQTSFGGGQGGLFGAQQQQPQQQQQVGGLFGGQPNGGGLFGQTQQQQNAGGFGQAGGALGGGNGIGGGLFGQQQTSTFNSQQTTTQISGGGGLFGGGLNLGNNTGGLFGQTSNAMNTGAVGMLNMGKGVFNPQMSFVASKPANDSLSKPNEKSVTQSISNGLDSCITEIALIQRKMVKMGQLRPGQQQPPGVATNNFNNNWQPGVIQQQPSQQAAGGLFGQQQQPFGQQQQPQQQGGLFGGATGGVGGGLFGGAGTQPIGGAAPGGLFGGAGGATTAGAGGLFGAPAGGQQQQQQGGGAAGGLFGGLGATQPAGAGGAGGLFGAPQQTQPAAGGGGGLFGGAATGTQTGLFGAPAQQQQTGGLFGGQTGTTGGGLFGAPAAGAPGGGGLFGAPAANKPTTQGGLFGAPATAGGGLFGNTQATTTGGGLFGGMTSGAIAPASGTTVGLFGTTQQASVANATNAQATAAQLFSHQFPSLSAYLDYTKSQKSTENSSSSLWPSSSSSQSSTSGFGIPSIDRIRALGYYERSEKESNNHNTYANYTGNEYKSLYGYAKKRTSFEAFKHTTLSRGMNATVTAASNLSSQITTNNPKDKKESFRNLLATLSESSGANHNTSKSQQMYQMSMRDSMRSSKSSQRQMLESKKILDAIDAYIEFMPSISGSSLAAATLNNGRNGLNSSNHGSTNNNNYESIRVKIPVKPRYTFGDLKQKILSDHMGESIDASSVRNYRLQARLKGATTTKHRAAPVILKENDNVLASKLVPFLDIDYVELIQRTSSILLHPVAAGDVISHSLNHIAESLNTSIACVPAEQEKNMQTSSGVTTHGRITIPNTLKVTPQINESTDFDILGQVEKLTIENENVRICFEAPVNLIGADLTNFVLEESKISLENVPNADRFNVPCTILFKKFGRKQLANGKAPSDVVALVNRLVKKLNLDLVKPYDVNTTSLMYRQATFDI